MEPNLLWSIFTTGQTAQKKRRVELADSLGAHPTIGSRRISTMSATADVSPGQRAIFRADEPLLVRKLNRHTPLSQRDRQSLSRILSLDVRSVRFRSTLGEAGTAPKKLAVMLDGWACCYRVLRDGRRQLVACHLPGDVCDFHTLLAPRPDTVIVLLAGARVARLSRETVSALLEAHPLLARALWSDARIASSVEREWLVNLAQRDARERVAHMICEFVARAEAVGEVNDDSIHCPLTQADFAQACGMTATHANRVLRLLREQGLIAWRNSVLRVPDRDALAAEAGFSSAYLDPPAASAPHADWLCPIA